MSAPHFFVPSIDTEIASVGGPDAAHALRALRIKVGEPLSLSDGRGGRADAIVEGVEDGTLRARIRSRVRTEPPRPRVTVHPAVSKHEKLDAVVQKLVEIGVAAIRPWLAERSIVRWDDAKLHAHAERWRAIAYSAAKQSHRVWLPEVDAPARTLEPAWPAVALHEEAADRLHGVLPDDPPPTISVVIGPEGGLAEGEVSALQRGGASLASLGSLILRTETAAVVGPALVLARYGLLG